MAYEKPLPKPNADTRPFWEGCQENQLRFQKCPHCDHIRWPPSVICPKCHSSDTEWIVASGKGMIYSYVVYHVAFHPAFENDLPYVTAVVKLAEGPYILTRIQLAQVQTSQRVDQNFCSNISLDWENQSWY